MFESLKISKKPAWIGVRTYTGYYGYSFEKFFSKTDKKMLNPGGLT